MSDIYSMVGVDPFVYTPGKDDSVRPEHNNDNGLIDWQRTQRIGVMELYPVLKKKYDDEHSNAGAIHKCKECGNSYPVLDSVVCDYKNGYLCNKCSAE